MGKRVLSMWFPRFASDRHCRRQGCPPDEPLAVLAEKKSALRIHCLTAAAEALGLSRGLSLTDARAAIPTLTTALHDPHDTEQALRGLHRWAGRYSPSVAMDGEDGLLLDLTGCTHLFGGEEATLAAAREGLADLGYEVRLALTDTAGSARALSRFQRDPFPLVVPPGKARPLLSALPVEAIDADTRSFRRLGLKTLGDVVALPRKELTKRFGGDVTARLDETMGTRMRPVSALPPARQYAARMSFPEPVGLLEDLMEALRRTLFSVCGQLERDGRGARLVGVVFDQAGGSTTETSIGLARPSTDHTAMLRQFEPFLGRFDVGFGIDRLRVVALRHEPAHMRQLSVGEETVREAAFEELVGRLGNRLGFDRVTRPLPLDSHLAGQDVALVPAVAPAPPRSSPSPSRHEWTRQPSSDPLRLIPPVPLAPLGEGRPPRRFQWRGGVAEVTSVRGPRRLTGEWWHTNAARRGFRDYWDVETRTGGRLWLRCDVSPDGTRHWSVAGSLP